MSMFSPLVSIVIPVYNGANYMREAIDSALAQTYKNIEIIVVNDGSTDDGETERIALSYGDKIRYFKKENGGCASALNFGIAQMRGEWFSWLSHDDVYMPTKVESAVSMIEKYHLTNGDTVISCGSMVIDGNGKAIRSSVAGKEEQVNADAMFARFMCNGFALNGCALLIPKNILDTVGTFSTEYIYILDWMYWVNIALAGFSFLLYSEPLVKNRRHSGQVTVKKQHLFAGENERFAGDLYSVVNKHPAKLHDVWTFCCRNGFTEQRKLIEKRHTIPARVRWRGIYKRVRLDFENMLRKVYRLRYR